MTENASVAQHLNEFNTITNQLSHVEIDFDDEIRALIVLALLPNSWEAMRMAVSNSTGKEKLKYNDIHDLVLTEEIRKRDVGEISGSNSALNLETRGRGNDKNSNQGRSKSIPIRTEVNLDLANKCSVGTVAKLATLRGTAKALRRRMMMILPIL